MIETHRRRELLAQHARAADIQWAEAIIPADPLWGPDQDWKTVLDRTTTQAPVPGPPAANDGAYAEEFAEPALPGPPHHAGLSGSGDDDAELAALESDLQSLYRPYNDGV